MPDDRTQVDLPPDWLIRQSVATQEQISQLPQWLTGKPSVLEAELARVKAALARAKFGPCEVCWTNSWIPIAASDPDAQALKDGSGFVRCDMCYVTSALGTMKAELAACRAERDATHKALNDSGIANVTNDGKLMTLPERIEDVAMTMHKLKVQVREAGASPDDSGITVQGSIVHQEFAKYRAKAEHSLAADEPTKGYPVVVWPEDLLTLLNAEAALAQLQAERDAAVAGREHVAWVRYIIEHDRPTRIVLCDSDAPGAFKVYRLPAMDDMDRKIRAAFTKYDGVGK